MILLAVDTALASCSACVYDSTTNKILSEERELMERGHAEALPPMVARVMAKSGLGYKDLNRIAVTTGPGTFTGVRIGLSFARAMGLACNIRVLGLHTLLATQVAVSQAKLPIIVAHKSGSSDFIHILNSNISNNIEISNWNEFGSLIPVGPHLVVGTAAAEIVARSGRSDLMLDPIYDLPSAMGFAAYAAGQPEPTLMPEPVYLRDADAKPQAAPLRGLPDLKVGLAALEDVELLARLHASCFEEAWDATVMTTLLKSPGCGALVATSAEGPVGLLIYRAVADEAEILTLGVDPNLRRRGAGKALLEALLALKTPKLFLEVASRNDDAVHLYIKAGFKQVGLRKGYYAKTGDDALILRWAV
jgi:tRNA threonylcarbamoyl adenosine modification protein YeaZ